MECVPRPRPPIYSRYDPSDERQLARMSRILLAISGSSQRLFDPVAAGDFVDTGLHLHLFVVFEML